MMKPADTKISLARIYYPVKVLGPGNRVGIWMYGCRRKCDGCISPELQVYDSSKEVSVDEIMRMIGCIEKPIDGFTISGGEPFYKPEAIASLVRELASVNDDILIFTGYRYEELKELHNEAVDAVLDTCSVLVDGPYVKELNNNKGLRGSTNQTFRIFKHKEKYEGIEEEEREIQNVMHGKSVLTIGIPGGEANND